MRYSTIRTDVRIKERTDLLTRAEAAEMLGVTVVTISNYLLAGVLGGEKIGTHVFVSREEVRAIADLNACRTKP